MGYCGEYLKHKFWLAVAKARMTTGCPQLYPLKYRKAKLINILGRRGIGQVNTPR